MEAVAAVVANTDLAADTVPAAGTAPEAAADIDPEAAALAADIGPEADTDLAADTGLAAGTALEAAAAPAGIAAAGGGGWVCGSCAKLGNTATLAVKIAPNIVETKTLVCILCNSYRRLAKLALKRAYSMDARSRQ